MTDGTSQGLFIVVAIVIFGIFVVMAYILFEDTLSPALASMFVEATEQASVRLNYSKDYAINGGFDKYVKVNYVWDKALNGEYISYQEHAFDGWTSGYNSGVFNPTKGYHAHLDIHTFGQPVMALPNKNSLVPEVNQHRWLGFNQKFEPYSEFNKNVVENSYIEVSFDMYSDVVGGFVSIGVYQKGEGDSDFFILEGTTRTNVASVEKNKWDRHYLQLPVNDKFDVSKQTAIIFYGHVDTHLNATKYVDNIEIRIAK